MTTVTASGFMVERHPEKMGDQLTEIAIESRATLRQFYKIKASYQFPPDEQTYPTLTLVAKNAGREPVAAVQIENHGTHLYFYKLGVRDAYRNKGLARLLVQAAVKIAHEWNLPRIEIKTIEATGNVEILKRLGFQENSRGLSTIFDSPKGLPVMEVTMQLPVKVDPL